MVEADVNWRMPINLRYKIACACGILRAKTEVKMVIKLQQGVLPFKIEKSDEPLIARAGLVLPYEMAG